jgi:hypothetical protein
VRHDGDERVEHADVVIDATGVYASPNPLGNGGAPCPGETSLRSRIDYALPDVTGRDRNRFANRHTLVVGSGHSAASTVRSLGDLFSDYPDTRITWVVRRDVPSHGFPYTLNPDQSSPQRDALHRRANELSLHANVCFCPRTVVDAIEYSNERFRVTLNTQVASGTKRNLEEYDNLVCHTGFRPDRSLWTELQMMEHPATGGPFSLAETILRANRRSGLGLSTGYARKTYRVTHIELEAPVEEIHAENEVRLLVQNEPNFFVAGIKSYGRDAGFLMQNGFRQVRDVYKLSLAITTSIYTTVLWIKCNARNKGYTLVESQSTNSERWLPEKQTMTCLLRGCERRVNYESHALRISFVAPLRIR